MFKSGKPYLPPHLSFLSVAFVSVSDFVPLPQCFDYHSYSILKSGTGMLPALFFFFFPEDCFGHSRSFLVSYEHFIILIPYELF
jgi:hypothetical protein